MARTISFDVDVLFCRDFSYNKLTSLPNGGDFQNITVNTLTINANRITKIPAGAFRDTTATSM